MTVIVPIWQHKQTKKYFCRCWNCGEESERYINVADAMKAARKHFKTCSAPGRWTTAQNRENAMVGCEFTFG